MTESLYKTELLKHFRQPNNRGGLEDAQLTGRGSNPRCGDALEIGVFYSGKELNQVRFEGRGCSVCIASASMMTEAVAGLSKEHAYELCDEVKNWFTDNSRGSVEALPSPLLPLSAIRQSTARRRCVLLCWEALKNALECR